MDDNTTPNPHPNPHPNPTSRPPNDLGPVEIAPDTWLIQDAVSEGPTTVHMNSMVIRAAEPVVVDTGRPANRGRYLDDVFGLVDPEDLRWVVVSHDDIDHYGNVAALMDACPNATLVGTWFLQTRLDDQVALPPNRWRWTGDGGTLDVGDRTLAFVRPPLYDSPTTRGVFDPATGVYWASDCYATPVPAPTAYAEDLDPDEWANGLTTFGVWNSPWVSLVDQGRFADECRRVESLDLRVIASCHGPVIEASLLARAHELVRSTPTVSAPPQPDQGLLDQIIAGIEAEAAA